MCRKRSVDGSCIGKTCGTRGVVRMLTHNLSVLGSPEPIPQAVA